jgi:tripartite-type tricarboxylate transporter receptor subunit TctC
MVVTFPAGAGNDAVGRILAERMRGSLGQPIVIENVTGAEGSIGTGRAARAPFVRRTSSLSDLGGYYITFL